VDLPQGVSGAKMVLIPWSDATMVKGVRCCADAVPKIDSNK